MGPHLQSQILAIFNFYVSMKKYEICIKTFFCSQCASVGRRRKLIR